MAQMTWRVPDELLERVRKTALRRGRSMNELVTDVMDVATNPDLAGSPEDRLRERLEQAGLAVSISPSERIRPSSEQFERARAAARGGTSLSELVDQGR